MEGCRPLGLAILGIAKLPDKLEKCKETHQRDYYNRDPRIIKGTSKRKTRSTPNKHAHPLPDQYTHRPSDMFLFDIKLYISEPTISAPTPTFCRTKHILEIFYPHSLICRDEDPVQAFHLLSLFHLVDRLLDRGVRHVREVVRLLLCALLWAALWWSEDVSEVWELM